MFCNICHSLLIEEVDGIQLHSVVLNDIVEELRGM
jgi:hypothetical protein